jgi:hypothetical protein
VSLVAIHSVVGLGIVAVVAALAIAGIFVLSRRKPVTAGNVNDVDESDIDRKEPVTA